MDTLIHEGNGARIAFDAGGDRDACARVGKAPRTLQSGRVMDRTDPAGLSALTAPGRR